MARILLAYCTHEGQSRKIADALAEEARTLDHEVDMLDVSLPKEGFDPGHYDGFIVGGSVNRMRHDPALVEFVMSNLRALDAKPSAFFSVSLAASSDEEPGPTDAVLMAQDFFRETGWHPALFETMAGALIYSKYNPAVKQVMRFAAWMNHGPTDASRDYELTDWDGVRRFARDVVATIERGQTPSPESPIDRYLRFYDLGVVHEVARPGARDEAWRAAMETDLRPGAVAQALEQLRQLSTLVGDQPLTLGGLLDTEGSPLRVLDQSEGAHVVVGAVGKFWTPQVEWKHVEPEAFATADESEFGRIVVGLQITDGPEASSRIRLEARVAAPDEQARRHLRVQWMLIGPVIRFALERALEVIAEA